MASPPVSSVDDAVERIGLGRFQWRLLGVNGLVWAGDAMEVIGIGFIIPSVVATFGVAGAQAGLVGSRFFAGMLFGVGLRVARRPGRSAAGILADHCA